MSGWDGRLERSVHTFVLGHRWLFHLASWLTHLGDPLVVTAASLALAVALLVRRRNRAASFVLVVRAVAIVADTAMKQAVGRARPALSHPLATASGPSFPSGHAFGAAALWGTVAILLPAPRWVQVLTAAVVPVVVAATRVVLGVHYLSDVAAGLAFGWIVAWAAAATLRPGDTLGSRPSAKVNGR